MRSLAKVREVLTEHRQAGEAFSVAWLAAVRALEPDERREWVGALEETIQAWRDAFEGKPASRAQLALSVIDEDPERDVPVLEPDALGEGLRTLPRASPERQALDCSLLLARLPAGRARPPSGYCLDHFARHTRASAPEVAFLTSSPDPPAGG